MVRWATTRQRRTAKEGSLDLSTRNETRKVRTTQPHSQRDAVVRLTSGKESFIPLELFAPSHIVPDDTVTLILVVVQEHDERVGIPFGRKEETPWSEVIRALLGAYLSTCGTQEGFTAIGDTATSHEGDLSDTMSCICIRWRVSRCHGDQLEDCFRTCFSEALLVRHSPIDAVIEMPEVATLSTANGTEVDFGEPDARLEHRRKCLREIEHVVGKKQGDSFARLLVL